ncbi:MAG: glycosyltransferase family 39 protein [Heliobacteriaceae bacterium]|jgi:4-amino-4-deoxy-L-arabinose transferase-like glycosyltransferase|nr:glycosyltransferase family 39 protein [Heliobacteriaceae bacterium]
MTTDTKNFKQRAFVIFLIVHVVVWSLLPFVRDLLPVDALETIAWGGLWDFGTHKHPPLSGWMGYIAYNLLGKMDFALYLLGQLCVLIGFVYLYKLGRKFLNETQAILAVMILEGCHCYSYMTVFDGFSANFPLFALFPAIAYYFYKSMQENKIRDWLLLGVCVGLCFLSKYQTIMLIIPMALYLFFIPHGREQLKRSRLYLSVLIAFLLFLPHLVWLYNHEFFSLLYFEECSARYANSYSGWIKYLQAPFMFILAQLAAVAGSILLFVILRLKFKSANSIRTFNDSWFLILLGICPVLFQALPGFFTGAEILGTWGYPMVYLTGIMLFYFFPIKTSDKLFSWGIKFAYGVMVIIFVVLLVLFSVEKNFRSRYPYQKIARDFKTIFYEETGKPLKYIGGYIEFALPISVYDETHPQMVLDSYGHENPWTKADNIKQAGALIVARHYDNVKSYTEKLLPFLPENYVAEPKEYEFTIYNKLKKPREYKLFYIIIPPEPAYDSF